MNRAIWTCPVTWALGCGIVAIFLTSIGFAIASPRDTTIVVAVAALPPLCALSASTSTYGLSTRGAGRRQRSVTAVILLASMAGFGAMAWFVGHRTYHKVEHQFIVLGLVAAFAGFRATRAVDRVRWQCVHSLLGMWATPAVVHFILGLPSGGEFRLGRAGTPALGLLCGPYATYAVGLGNWPNPGEGFYPPLAIVLTLFFVALSAVVLISRKRDVIAASLMMWPAAFAAWTIVAIGQLLNCAS